MYEVEYVTDNSGRTTLVITDDYGEREYTDGGDPEDNSFSRDWEWVAEELSEAYKQGFLDGAEEEREKQLFKKGN